MMINRISQKEEQNSISWTSEDSKIIKEIMSGLVGETCWQAELSYGDELSLDFGKKIPYSNPLMSGEFKGSWILGTRATEWRIECNGEQIVDSEAESEEMKDKIKILENTQVVRFDSFWAGYPPFRLLFSNGCQLLLNIFVPNDPELPYYELFTPNNMLLTVGGETPWSYVSADSPVS